MRFLSEKGRHYNFVRFYAEISGVSGSSETELICGFQAGGDDYVTKPFRMQELFLRIQEVLCGTGKKSANLRYLYPIYILSAITILVQQTKYMVI